MDEAKAAVKDFTSRAGKHQTTVHEHHRPAVTHEHITPKRHEESTTVVNREVHQEHYHTSVQPIHHRETLPEKHHHNLVAVEKKEHHHGNKEALKERLAAESAHFKDVSETGEEEHTQEVRPVVTGEHVHHHVHHTIQPIIQKETIQPTIVHTTIPIHEVHHNEARHHAAAALPAISLADWKKAGGSMTGKAVSTSHYDGEPDMSKFGHHGRHGTGTAAGTVAAGTAAAAVAAHHHDHEKQKQLEKDPHSRGVAAAAVAAAQHDKDKQVHQEKDHHGRGTTAAAVGVGAAAAEARHKHHEHGGSKMDPRVDHRVEGERAALATGATSHERALEGDRRQPAEPVQQFADTHAGSKMDTIGSTTDSVGSKTPTASDRHAVGVASTTGSKLVKNTPHQSNVEAAHHGTKKDGAHPPKRRSLMDRLNPRKEANGDGKRGVNK